MQRKVTNVKKEKESRERERDKESRERKVGSAMRDIQY